MIATDALAGAMESAGLLEHEDRVRAGPWIETFVAAYGDQVEDVDHALDIVRELRSEGVRVPALELERLRSRQVLFYLDAVAQYVDDQAELRELPLQHDLSQIATEFGISTEEALASVRMALTGSASGPALELLFPLLGHDRIMLRIGAISSQLLHGRGLDPIKFGPDGRPFAPIQGRRPSTEH